MAPVAPTWVAPPYGVAVFEPYPDGPTIFNLGTYLDDQDELDAVVAAATASGLRLLYSDGPPPDPNPGTIPVDPFIRYNQPQPDLSVGEQTQAQENMGGPFGGGGGGGGSFFYEIESQGTLTGVDDSALIQAAIDASIAGAEVFGPAPVRGRPGVTYRGKLLDPTGAWLQFHGSGIKIPDGGTAHNLFVPTGAWRLEGGDFNGNKGATADPGVTTDGCGIYQATSGAGWSGVVELLNAPKFHDFWWNSTNFSNTDATLHDADNAPDAAVYLDRVESYNNGKIGQRFTGIGGVVQVAPKNHGNGSHGIRWFLCRNPIVIDGNSSDNPTGHGLTSLYCSYPVVRGGHYDRNGTTDGTHDGIVFGGDSTSNVNMPGRNQKVTGATANGNGRHGIIGDASLAGTNALLIDADYPSGRGVNDPVETWGQFTDCTANDNADEGMIFNSSQYVAIHNPITDRNGGHGIELATRNATITGVHHAHHNGQKPLALEGATHWGAHRIVCVQDYFENTPDDTMTITGTQDPSQFAEYVYTRRAVTANTTAKLGELLALDTTGGTFVVTLPEIAFVAPGRIHAVWIAGAVAPTFALTGSDKVNTSSGTTTPTFTFLDQSFTLESDPVNSIWSIVGGRLPIAKLDLRYAPFASPAFTGTPTAPTAAPGTNTTQLSTTAFVTAAIAALVNSAPGILDTLGEIATALQADESTAAALATTVAGKQALDATLTALAALATGADKLPYSTGTDTFAQADFTAAARTLLDDTTTGAMLTTLGAEAVANKDTDGTLAANSDTKYASQKAVKTYVDTLLADNQTGTTYTLALSDWGLVVELNNASAIVLTVPLNATLALPVGFWCELWVQGAGQVTVTPESGSVNLRSNGGKLKSNGQYSSIALRKRGTNEWAVAGDLTT